MCGCLVPDVLHRLAEFADKRDVVSNTFCLFYEENFIFLHSSYEAEHTDTFTLRHRHLLIKNQFKTVSSLLLNIIMSLSYTIISYLKYD